MGPIQDVLVLGGGSAGFLAALSLKAKLPSLAVTVYRSPEIGIIGVGEGTTAMVPRYLHGYLNLDIADFIRRAQPVWKLAIKFLNWGPRESFYYTFRPQCDVHYNRLPKPFGFYCDEDFSYTDVSSALMAHGRTFRRQADGSPLVDIAHGYHLENHTFAAYLEQAARRSGVAVVDDTVVEVNKGPAPDAAPGAAGAGRAVESIRFASGRVARADLYVDCSGFRSVILGQALGEPFVSYKPTLFCDRAVAGGWERGPDEPIQPYTTAQTMDAGWSWRIDHEHRVHRGYVYSSAFIGDDQAEQEFRRKNPKVGATRVIRFVTGRRARSWVGNVVAIGNAAGFVEPLEATSLTGICEQCHALTRLLIDCDRVVGPRAAEVYSRRDARYFDAIRDFLAVHYRFNTRLDTPFWREAREKVDLCGAAALVEFYRENGPTPLWRVTLLDPHDGFQMEGYLTLLVGQRVPWARRYVVSPQEAQVAARTRETFRKEGMAGLTAEESLEWVRRPTWKWSPGAYPWAC